MRGINITGKKHWIGWVGEQQVRWLCQQKSVHGALFFQLAVGRLDIIVQHPGIPDANDLYNPLTGLRLMFSRQFLLQSPGAGGLYGWQPAGREPPGRYRFLGDGRRLAWGLSHQRRADRHRQRCEMAGRPRWKNHCQI